MKNVKILSTGSYVPELVVTNEDLTKIVDTSDEWIQSRTGIKERRVSRENTSELCYKAAKDAISNAGIEATDIDLIIVATLTPDMATPSTACIVQDKLEIYDNCSSFDLNSACTGFVYALNVGTQLIRTGQHKRALIIGAETLTKVTDWTDRGTCVLFGDGAGAAILEATDEVGVGTIYTGSKGDGDGTLTVGGMDFDNPFVDKVETLSPHIRMNGKKVFKFAVNAIHKSVDKVLESEGLTYDDIKYIVPHQANYRIISFCAKNMKLSEDKFFMNLENYGNTSAASIGIALDEMNKKGMLEKGDKIVLVGFGGGLTWGAAVITW